MSIMTPWFQAFKGMNTPSVNVSGSGSIRVHWNALKMGGGGQFSSVTIDQHYMTLTLPLLLTLEAWCVHSLNLKLASRNKAVASLVR